VLYVSHDRYFINQTATRILELTGQTLVNYIGNYDYYLEKKEELTRILCSCCRCRRSGRSSGSFRSLLHKAGLESAERRTGTSPQERKRAEKDGETN